MTTDRSGRDETTPSNNRSGLDQPASGEVIIDDERITGLTEDRLACSRLEEIIPKALLIDAVEVASKRSSELGAILNE